MHNSGQIRVPSENIHAKCKNTCVCFIQGPQVGTLLFEGIHKRVEEAYFQQRAVTVLVSPFPLFIHFFFSFFLNIWILQSKTDTNFIVYQENIIYIYENYFIQKTRKEDRKNVWNKARIKLVIKLMLRKSYR